MDPIFGTIKTRLWVRRIYMIKNITRVNLAVAAALAILISGCSIANLGWLRNSEDVSLVFETLHVSPDYRYWPSKTLQDGWSKQWSITDIEQFLILSIKGYRPGLSSDKSPKQAFYDIDRQIKSRN